MKHRPRLTPTLRAVLGTWNQTAVAFLLLMLVLTSCDEFPANSKLGVSIDPQDVLSIHFIACPGELVTDLSVVVLEGAFVGDENDEILWEISSSPGGSLPLVLQYGDVPPGFAETVQAQPLPPSEIQLGINVNTMSSGSAVVFDVGGLSEGRAFSDGASLDFTEFERRAREACG
jgi:hypothetical protein